MIDLGSAAASAASKDKLKAVESMMADLQEVPMSSGNPGVDSDSGRAESAYRDVY